MMLRRTLLTALLAVTQARAETPEPFAALERMHGGRLGVAVLDTGTGRRMGHRGDEIFPLCSTFKFLLTACVLTRVDRGLDRLDRRIIFSRHDLLAHAPVTQVHVGVPGMTLQTLCEAVMTYSDNTAANLLLGSVGGPAGVTAYARTLGDRVTRLDRIEPGLNEVGPGDVRDTTSPDAMLDNMRKIALGDALSAASRGHIIAWLMANSTGDARLRAGVPKLWRVGDKTGTGPAINNAVNDIAVIWPPQRAPLIVAAYYAFSPALQAEREMVLAQVARSATKL